MVVIKTNKGELGLDQIPHDFLDAVRKALAGNLRSAAARGWKYHWSLTTRNGKVIIKKKHGTQVTEYVVSGIEEKEDPPSWYFEETHED